MRRAALCILFAAPLAAQIAIDRPKAPLFIRPYEAPLVPPVRLTNSERLGASIRAGKMYLSLHDALTLALENNLSLEAARYDPLLADWALLRAQAGGPIRGVPSASAQVAGVDSGVGVAGSTVSAGLGGGGGGNGVGANGGASIQQIGAIVPNLDPILQNTTTFSHLTTPQANTVLSQTSALIQNARTYSSVYQQGLLSGGYFQIRDYEQRLNENAPSDALNPALGPHVDLYIRHNLLQGFGTRLNGRLIRIAELNIEGSREELRSQTLDLVANVANIYWDLAASLDLARARRSAVEVAQKFYGDTKARIDLGALARVELPRAAVELATRKQDLAGAEADVRRNEILLKAAIARSEDPAFDSADIVPLDRIEIPDNDELPPLREMLRKAMSARPDVALSRIRGQAAEISAIGTENPLLPTLQVSAQTYNRGAAGTPQASGGAANPAFVGGYGTALGQIFRRDFPSESASVSLSMPVGNRQAQGDYGIEQLQLRQSAVRNKRDENQILVDISNQAIALRQARARYSAAATTRELQEQLLQGEQDKFTYGKAGVTGLIVAQRALVEARAAEIAARAAYAHARVSLDQVLGSTLEANHIPVK